MTISLLALNPFLVGLIQQGYLERIMKEALVSETLFRRDIPSDVFQGKIGERKYIPRSGLLPISLVPGVPGVDPIPGNYAREAYYAEMRSYPGTVDAYLPHDYIGVVKESTEKAQKIGIQAAQTIDRLARQSLYRAYLAGNTNAVAAAGIGAFNIQVASLNGFTESNVATTGMPAPVSATNPLVITFGGLEPARNVVAFAPNNPADPLGPGILTINAALTVGVALREAVLAQNRSLVIYSGGGNSVDNIAAGDTLTMADLVNATGQLRRGPASVPMFGGAYRAHMPVIGQTQLLADPLIRGMIHDKTIPVEWADASIGKLGKALLIENPGCPDAINSGALVTSGALAFCAPEIGADVINNVGVPVAYTLVYGEGYAVEEYIPPGSSPAEVSMSEVKAMPPASSSDVPLNVERVEMTIRPPIDRRGKVTAFTWEWTGDFCIPTDITTQARRYRRACVICHAG